MAQDFISIVLPVYNEEAGIKQTIEALLSYCHNRDEKYELIFVNDGSQDMSPVIIEQAIASHPEIKLVNFSRNFGHQIAISAGIRFTSGNAVVVMDADLQDPPTVIPDMIAKWHEGYEVVYGQRAHRDGETFFKKATAGLFYRFLASVTSINIPVDTGDFRLMDRRVVDILKKMPEDDPFVRGMVSWVGFKQTAVLYDRHERIAGTSKYPLKKMIKLATDGITSFSLVPLKLAQWLGSLFLIGGVISLITGLVAGFSITLEVMLIGLFIGGAVLVCLGLLGNYVGRIFLQSRQRPLYIVADTKGFRSQYSTLKAETEETRQIS